MVDTSNDGNGRVTMAVLNNEVQHMRQDMAEMRQELKYLSGHIAQIANDQLKRINDLEKCDSAREERWTAHREEHTREAKNQYTFATVLSTVTSAISGIVATLVGKP